MARAIWKGVIRFGGVAVPVKLYSAVQDRNVHFRLLHDRDRTPLKQRMVDPVSGDVVPYEEIRKGYETEDGAFVMLEPEELEELEPDSSRDIEITRFVPPSRINHQWYDRPYYLGPDGDDSSYFALADALERKEVEGLARWTMRKKAYVGALRLEDAYPMLITLRHAGEVLSASELPQPGGRAPDAREVAMARQLIGMLEADYDPTEWRDEYRDRVLDLVETKARGGKVKVERIVEKKPKQKSLEAMLRASLESAREGRAA